MDNIKSIVTGGIITLFVGGAAYSFTQEDLVNNLADDTGLTQEQAELYVNSIPDDQFATWAKIGSDEIEASKETLSLANKIDCVNYEYEWETNSLSCSIGKSQLLQMAVAERALGEAYIEMSKEDADETEMRAVIRLLDEENTAYDLDISKALFDEETMSELKMTNSYNKSLLNTALESE